jgi:hypothetical protein
MRRVSLEQWLFFIPAALLALLLLVLWVIIYDYEPPKFIQFPILVATIASPFIACGVILSALILRARGVVRLKDPYVRMGIILACINILIMAGWF